MGGVVPGLLLDGGEEDEDGGAVVDGVVELPDDSLLDPPVVAGVVPLEPGVCATGAPTVAC